jgi:hypothetical protein
MRVKIFFVLLVIVSCSFLLIAEGNAVVPHMYCATGGCTFTVAANTPICKLQTTTEDAQGANDPSFNYPYGLIEFYLDAGGCGTIEGPIPNAITTKIFGLPSPATTTFCFFDAQQTPIDMSGFVYRKYGPTPDKHTPHWYDFMYDSQTGTGAVINNNCITLYFVDGERGDDDLTENQVIVDQGGPGQGGVAVPTMSEWGIIIFILLAGVGSVYYLRRQRRIQS